MAVAERGKLGTRLPRCGCRRRHGQRPPARWVTVGLLEPSFFATSMLHPDPQATASLDLVRTSLADVLEPFSASRLGGLWTWQRTVPLAGLAAAEIPWLFAPKHTVPVMAANPHTTAHTFLARILAPWAEALSPVSLRNSSKSRRRLSSDKRRRSSHCALVHSPPPSQAATCILVLRFSKADKVALRTNHNRSSPPRFGFRYSASGQRYLERRSVYLHGRIHLGLLPQQTPFPGWSSGAPRTPEWVGRTE